MATKKKNAISTIPGKMIYHNMDFIDSDSGRPIRIIAEFMAPNQIFQQEGVQNTIVLKRNSRASRGSKPWRNTTMPPTNWVQK